MLRTISLFIQVIGYFTMGVLHFIYGAEMTKVIPPYLPYPLALVYISGVAEMGLALGLLSRTTRRWACYGLMLLLVAVFPANIYMFTSEQTGWTTHHWFLFWRLPAQALLIAWAYWQSKEKAR